MPVPGNEMRRDYLLDRYVIVAENRGARPHDFIQAKPPAREGSTLKICRGCFFCPGNEKLTPPETGRVGTKAKWVARSFCNKFPALAAGFRKAAGAHEVIVETQDHAKQMSQLPVKQIAAALQLCQQRIAALYRNPKIRYVLVFKNQGPQAGTSLIHSHSQLIAVTTVPPSVAEEMAAYGKAGKCVFCGVAKKEANGPRKIFEDRHFLAFAPYASRSAFEVWLLPKRHVRNLTDLSAEERLSLAGMLKKILGRLDSLFKFPQFNYYMHIAPKGKDFHFHIELLPRLTVWAGFELGSGMYINPVPPEKAAAALRHGKAY